MSVLSVNPSFETSILSDSNFLYSHFYTLSTMLTPDMVTGNAMPAYAVGRRLDFYETASQGLATDICTQAQTSLNRLLASPEHYKDRATLQSIMAIALDDFEDIYQPVYGLNAIIALDQLVQMEFEGNIITEVNDNDDLTHAVTLDSYVSYLGYHFCTNLDDGVFILNKDATSLADNSVCASIRFFGKAGGKTDKSLNFTVSRKNWAYELLRHYEHGRYKLQDAVATAKTRPYAFALIVASILGIDTALLDSYEQTDSFASLNKASQIRFIMTIKPLIERISVDFFNNKLPSL